MDHHDCRISRASIADNTTIIKKINDSNGLTNCEAMLIKLREPLINPSRYRIYQNIKIIFLNNSQSDLIDVIYTLFVPSMKYCMYTSWLQALTNFILFSHCSLAYSLLYIYMYLSYNGYHLILFKLTRSKRKFLYIRDLFLGKKV